QGAPSRALAANLLAKDSDAQSLEQLEQALDDKNAGVRAAAASALGRRFSRSSIRKLEPLLEDKAEGPRYMAAAAIIRLTGKKSIVPQKPKAQENDPLTRCIRISCGINQISVSAMRMRGCGSTVQDSRPGVLYR